MVGYTDSIDAGIADPMTFSSILLSSLSIRCIILGLPLQLLPSMMIVLAEYDCFISLILSDVSQQSFHCNHIPAALH